MKYRVILIAIISILMATAKQWESHYDHTSFQTKLSRVNTLLNSTPTGLRALSRVGEFGIYRKAIKIQGVHLSELRQINGSNGAAIRQNEIGEFEIILNKNLSLNELAHIISHEAQHIADEKDRVSVIQQFPLAYESVSEVAYKVYNDRSIKLIEANKQPELIYVMKTLFCSEIRAYSINSQLKKEGLNTDRNFSFDAITKYVNNKYLGKFGAMVSDIQAGELAHECRQFRSFAKYQMHIINEMLRSKSSLVAKLQTKQKITNHFVNLLAYDSTDLDFEDTKSNVPGFEKKNDPNMPEVDEEDQSLNSQSHKNAKVIKEEASKGPVSEDYKEIDLASEGSR